MRESAPSSSTRAWLAAIALCCFFFGSLALARQEEEPEGEALGPPINEMCPVMPEEPVDPEFTIRWEGRNIGLCCSTCRRKFLREPEKYLALLPPVEEPSGAAVEESAVAGSGSQPASSDEGTIELAGRFHPLVVHFPIALLLAAVLAELLFALRGRAALRSAMRFCLGLGALAAVVAGLLGLAAARGRSFPGELSEAFDRHRAVGIATAVLAVACWALGLRATSSSASTALLRGWRALLALTAAALVYASHFGGVLVFGPDHLPF